MHFPVEYTITLEHRFNLSYKLQNPALKAYFVCCSMHLLNGNIGKFNAKDRASWITIYYVG